MIKNLIYGFIGCLNFICFIGALLLSAIMLLVYKIGIFFIGTKLDYYAKIINDNKYIRSLYKNEDDVDYFLLSVLCCSYIVFFFCRAFNFTFYFWISFILYIASAMLLFIMVMPYNKAYAIVPY